MAHPVHRLLELTEESELWAQLSVMVRSLVVAAARRDPDRAQQVLDRLAELWRRAKEDSGG